MNYIGEHLWVGQLGHALVVLAFVMAILSAFAYGFGVKAKQPELQQNWKKIGRISFWVHGASIFSVIGLLFFLMLQRYYEYEYAWGHVSDDLPFRYIFSAFWEGRRAVSSCGCSGMSCWASS
jgi:cytochrome c-type biogenesis protein CcmF